MAAGVVVVEGAVVVSGLASVVSDDSPGPAGGEQEPDYGEDGEEAI